MNGNDPFSSKDITARLMYPDKHSKVLEALWKTLYLVKGDREMTLPDKLLIVQSGKQTTCVDNPLVTTLSNAGL